jgi:hypothetical protein
MGFWSAFKGACTSAWDTAKRVVRHVAEAVGTVVEKVGEFVRGTGSKIKECAKDKKISFQEGVRRVLVDGAKRAKILWEETQAIFRELKDTISIEFSRCCARIVELLSEEQRVSMEVTEEVEEQEK